jgi:hypothetical protein
MDTHCLAEEKTMDVQDNGCPGYKRNEFFGWFQVGTGRLYAIGSSDTSKSG